MSFGGKTLTTRAGSTYVLLSRTIAVLAILLGLSACTSILGSFQPAPETFDITAPKSFPGLKGGTKAHLLVLEPSALKSLDSERIILKPGPSLVEYLAKAQWSDRLPRVVQEKLVQAFENTGRAKAVGKPGEGLVIDYQIVTDLRAFEVQLDTGNATVEISAKLVSDRSGRVLRSKIFSASVPTSGENALEIVDGLDAAFDQVARAMVQWVFAVV